MSGNATPPPAPTRDPALRRLERLVGTWSMTGHLIGSDEENIAGRATFRWLDGGLFLQQDTELDFAGIAQIRARELIWYDPDSDDFPSWVYSSFSGVPLPYRWDVRGDTLTIAVCYGQLDATFTGTFSPDGERFAGGWRPNPGADAAVNVPYDIGGRRVT